MYVRIVSSIGIDRMARTLRRTHSLPNLTTIVSAPSISTLRMEQELPLGIYLPDNVETMRRYVFNTIIDRLQASSVNTHSVSMEQLDFLLPKSGIVYWQLLLDFPMCTNISSSAISFQWHCLLQYHRIRSLGRLSTTSGRFVCRMGSCCILLRDGSGRGEYISGKEVARLPHWLMSMYTQSIL